MKHLVIETEGRKGFASDIKRDYKAEAKLGKIINRKQAVEWNMAKKLLAEFNDERTLLHGGLKGLVFNAIDDIVDIIEAKGEAAFRMAYYKDAVNYNFVKSDKGKKIFTSADEFLKTIKDRTYIESLRAAELGNLIRFYGEVIEAGKHLSNKPPPDWIQYPEWDKNYDHKRKSNPVNIPKQNWGAPPKDFNTKAYDARDGNLPKHLPTFFKGHERGMKSYQKFGAHDPLHKDEGFWDKSAHGHRRREEARKLSQQALQLYRAKQSRVEQALVGVGGGISLFVQLPQDLLNKIDLVFGLSHGATISGTTTDTIYFINRMSLLDKYMRVGQPDVPVPLYMQAYFEGWDWEMFRQTGGKFIVTRDSTDKIISKQPYVPDVRKSQYSRNGFRGVDPVYYMLPFGTIVGEAHHTTTEVAFPLALNLNYDKQGREMGNKIFDYSIGMYKKLMPERGEARKSAPGLGVGKINTILSDAENDPGNELILVYYTDNMERTGGYLRFDKGNLNDMKIWTQIAKAGPELLRTFKRFKPYPTKKDIASLHPAISNELGGSGEAPKFVDTGARDKFADRKAFFES